MISLHYKKNFQATLHIYKCDQNKTLRQRYMKQNADFQEGVSQA